VWHPQIVHDIHQQGANGARLFLPPYMAPVEPNVPKQIVEGYTELGNAMAADLRSKGFEGITTNTTYDAWTPARAYSHYHGGVRILSETASARIASPITVKFEDLRGASGGLDAKKESPNFGPLWKGGEWKLRNITDYMTGAAFSLLNHAANNREKWLSRFYEVGKEAVRPRKKGELFAFILPAAQEIKVSNNLSAVGAQNLSRNKRREGLIAILERAGVETLHPVRLRVNGKTYPEGTSVVRVDQPYGSFAKTLMERQIYPDLMDDKGNPIAPYDVTAHTLPLLMDVDVIPMSEVFNTNLPTTKSLGSGSDCRCSDGPRFAIYKSSPANMDYGWTNWIVEKSGLNTICCGEFDSILDSELRTGVKDQPWHKTMTIIFPDQPANQILNGYAKGSMPDEYVGGVGKEGVANLKKFVEDGGTLVFLNESSNFAIEQFNLPIKNVTKGLPRKEFYIPGSILRTELDTTHPITKGMPKESIAWFEDSPVFDYVPRTDSVPRVVVSEPSAADTQTKPIAPGTFQIRFIATYPSDPSKILLSGWALGAEKIAGKAALVEVRMGKGKIVLFG
ncbi:MAG: hypothetical protein ABL959_20095, partial [Pyrinomonadaceae bacterium]